MRIDTLVALLGAAICASGSAAQAQVSDDLAAATRAAGGPGAEFAMFGSLHLVVPTVGATLSMPIGRRLAVEGGASTILLSDETGRRASTHLQLRIPRHHASGGAWTSLVVGVATFPELDDFSAGGPAHTRLRPQVASTWHWLRPGGNGFRLDVGVLADFRYPVPWPYAKAAVVIPIGPRHPGDGR